MHTEPELFLSRAAQVASGGSITISIEHRETTPDDRGTTVRSTWARVAWMRDPRDYQSVEVLLWDSVDGVQEGALARALEVVAERAPKR